MKRSFTGALLTSCLVHAAFLAAGAWLLARALAGQTQAIEVTVAPSAEQRGIQLPTMASLGSHRALDPEAPRARPEPERVEAGRRSSRMRPDLGPAGRGGTRLGARSLGLVDEIANVALDRDDFDGRHQSQVQRLATSSKRRSLDNRRATPNPMQLTFVATGLGQVRSRQARGDGAPGSDTGTREPSRAGGRSGETLEDGWLQGVPGRAEPGSVAALALGSSASGQRPSLRAHITHARPAVTRARAAVPAHDRAQAADTMDSEAKVASTVRSLIQAGGLGDAQRGEGGEPGPDGLGRDGVRGSGARAPVSGTSGSGRGFSADTGLGRYQHQLLSRIHWQDAFPTWAIAEGRGGLASIGLTVLADGHVIQVQVLRSSGIAEFDRKLVLAIQRDAPYGPLPPAAGGRLRLEISFDALNPAVGREGPGPGARRR